jgi:heme exporter protein C
MNFKWWKVVCVVLLTYTIIAGLLFKVPALPILHETIRNLYFHVTMWFAMIFILSVSVYHSIRYLSGFDKYYDIRAYESSKAGTFLGVLGILTGSLWARYTWNAWWANDPKLNGAAITLLFYFAYFILRSSLDDEKKKARVSAIYNIFSYVMLIVFLLVFPRLSDSLHPGNGGNPGFNSYDLDNKMRMVFYPAVIGWCMFAYWLMDIGVRIKTITDVTEDPETLDVFMPSEKL